MLLRDLPPLCFRFGTHRIHRECHCQKFKGLRSRSNAKIREASQRYHESGWSSTGSVFIGQGKTENVNKWIPRGSNCSGPKVHCTCSRRHFWRPRWGQWHVTGTLPSKPSIPSFPFPSKGLRCLVSAHTGATLSPLSPCAANIIILKPKLYLEP